MLWGAAAGAGGPRACLWPGWSRGPRACLWPGWEPVLWGSASAVLHSGVLTWDETENGGCLWSILSLNLEF